jgi:hypothetical protein
MSLGETPAGIVQKQKLQGCSLYTEHTVIFYALLWHCEFSFERVCTFYKPLKLVTVVILFSIVTAPRGKSVLVLMGSGKGFVSSSFRAITFFHFRASSVFVFFLLLN